MTRASENLRAVLDLFGAEDLADLDRLVYKTTICGAWVAVTLTAGARVFGSALSSVDLALVRWLRVGSIVEGSDAEIEADPVDLSSFAAPGKAVAALVEAIGWVEGEACAARHDANRPD